MIYKNLDFKINIERADSKRLNSNTYIYTKDIRTGQVRLYLYWNNDKFKINESNLTPYLYLELHNGKVYDNETVDIIDSENGVIHYKIPEKVSENKGEVDVKLFLKNDNQKVHAGNFTFIIKDSEVVF